MTQEVVEIVVQLRAAVGALGEQGPKARWPSAFFAASSRSFLFPLYPRTLPLSQLRGVVMAAARVHDERIGVGGVYHLFRLPEEVERAVHNFAMTPAAAAVVVPASADLNSALATLARRAAVQTAPAVGPVRIGAAEEMNDVRSWQRVAGHYASGFRSDTEVYPFFSMK